MPAPLAVAAVVDRTSFLSDDGEFSPFLSVDLRLEGERNSTDIRKSCCKLKEDKSEKQSNVAKESRKCPVTRRVQRQTHNRIWLAE